MPLTPIQTRALRTIAANRSPDSYLAGATVLHRERDTPRFSGDLDLFHDLADSVALCAEADATTLREAGFELKWLLRTPAFYRAVLSAEGEQLRIEWAQDSAFRFFPVVEDVQCGYRLHHADAAVNKVLALAGRQEIRDFVDILHLHGSYLHLGSLAWAACGKDPGFTPGFLLEQAGRHAAYAQADLDRLDLREPLDLGSPEKEVAECPRRSPRTGGFPASRGGGDALSRRGEAGDARSAVGRFRGPGSPRGQHPGRLAGRGLRAVPAHGHPFGIFRDGERNDDASGARVGNPGLLPGGA